MTKKKLNINLFYGSMSFGNVYFERAIWILYYEKIGLSFFEIGIIQALINAAMLVADVPTGIFADRFGRKTAFLVGRGLIIVKYLIILSTRNFYWLAIGNFLFGTGIVFISGADQAFLYDSIKDSTDNYTKFAGAFNAISGLILAMSMAAGGFLQKESWSLVYLLTAVSQTIALFMAFFIKEDRGSDLDAVVTAGDPSPYALTYGEVLY